MKKKLIKVVLYMVVVLMAVFLLLILLQPKQASYSLLFQGVHHSVESLFHHKYESGAISTYGDVDYETFVSVCDAYEKLPDTIQKSFAEDDWTVVISAYPVNTIVTADDNMIAVAQHDTKVIYLYKDYAYAGVLLHEIGHYVDEKYGFVSKNIEDIRSRERSQLMELEPYLTKTDVAYGHNTEDSSEYFATAFAVFVMMPDDLYKKCPETYEYIGQVVSEHTKT